MAPFTMLTGGQISSYSPAASAEGRPLAYTSLDRAGADGVAMAEGAVLDAGAVDLYRNTPSHTC